jgi:hypothetical protein
MDRRPNAEVIVARALPCIGGLLLVVGLGACDTSVKIEGPKRWVVGQRVTLVRQHGGAFAQNDFTLTDAAGRVYPNSDPALDYVWVDDTEIRFTVPHSISAGPATVSVGADSGDAYVFDVEVVRLFGVLDVSGSLAFHGLDDPDRHYASYQVGVGQGYVTLSWEGDRLIAVAAATGEVHFLELTIDSLKPFAPSVELGIPLGRGALLDRGAVVASNEGVGYIVQLPNGALELDAWLQTGAVSALAAAPRFNRVVAAGVAGDATATYNVMYRIDASVSPPDLVEPDGVPIGGFVNGVTDVVMTPDGVLGIAVNTLDDTLTDVIFEAASPTPSQRSLPAEDVGAWRMVVDADSRWLAVLCEISKTVAVYALNQGGMAHSVSLLADPRAAAPDLAQAPVDAGFAPGGMVYVLLADGAVSEIDLSLTPPAAGMLREAQSNPGTALLIQP